MIPTVKGGREGPLTHLSGHGAAPGAGAHLSREPPAHSKQDSRDQGCGVIHSPDHRPQRLGVYTGMCTQVHACMCKTTQYMHKHAYEHRYAHPDKRTVRACTCKHAWHTHTHAHRYTQVHPCTPRKIHCACTHMVHTYTCTQVRPCTPMHAHMVTRYTHTHARAQDSCQPLAAACKSPAVHTHPSCFLTPQGPPPP